MTRDQIAGKRLPTSFAEQVQPDLAAVSAKVAELENEARSLIRQRPIVALLAAAGLGYLIARVVVRGTR